MQSEDDVIVPRAKFAVGTLTIDLVPGDNVDGLLVSAPQVPFLVGGGLPDCTLRTHCMPIPDEDWGEHIFSSGGLWSLYAKNGYYTVPLISRRTGPRPYRLARFDSEFGEGDFYVPPTDIVVLRGAPPLGSGKTEVDPLHAPIDEVIVVNLLARGRGLYVHGCGISDGRQGILFSGVSGAGKSTIANLWRSRQATILSDDRLVISERDGAFWVYGTPWHGDAKVSCPQGVPLTALYFITHSHHNCATRLSPVEAAIRLLVRCFPTFYHALGMEFTLSFIDRICTALPCFEFGFVPDDSAIDFAIEHASLAV